MRRTFRCAAALAAAGMSVAAHATDKLYGVAGYSASGNQALYEIDIDTGAATLIGFTGISQINGIAWNPKTSTLFAYTTDTALYTLSLSTGAATLVGDQPGIQPEGDIAFNADGELFSVGGDVLGTLNQSNGALTTIGALGSSADDVSGLAFDQSGTLFGYSMNGTNPDTLLEILPDSGLTNDLGPLGINSDSAVGGLAFNQRNGELYVTSGSILYAVNLPTSKAPASVTEIGPLGVPNFSGITFVPEPSTLALLAVAGVRRRRA